MSYCFVWIDILVLDFDCVVVFYFVVFGELVWIEIGLGFCFGLILYSGDDVVGCFYVFSDDNKFCFNGVLVYFNVDGCMVQVEVVVVVYGGKVLQFSYKIGLYGWCLVVLDSEGNCIVLYLMIF